MTREVNDEFRGKVAFVTGAGRGQGRAQALGLALGGARVIAVDICGPVGSLKYELSTSADLDATVAQAEAFGGTVEAVQCDVRNRDQTMTVVDRAIRQHGQIDIAVANAGVCGYGLVHELSEAQWDDMIAVNLTGTFNTLRAVLPDMVRRQTGSVIAIASSAAFGGTPHLAHYTASKWGVVGLVKSTALEVAASGVTVNAVCPVAVDTPMVHNESMYQLFAPDLDIRTRDTVRDRYTSLNPMGIPWISPEDVRDTVLFLASDRARYISGETIEIGAGRSGEH